MAFLKPLARYADLSGRASREAYWGFFLFQSIVGSVLAGMAMTVLTQSRSGDGALGFFVLSVLMVIAGLAFVVPHHAVTVRRLHDTDRSAWWMLLLAPAVVAPFSLIGGVVGAIGAALAGGLLLFVVGGVCNMITMALMSLPGTPGENRYGADPTGPDARLNRGGQNEGAGPDEARIDAMLAEARRDSGTAAASEPLWKSDLEFGRMEGPAAPEPAPMMRSSSATWPDLEPAPTFGRPRA